MKIIKFMDDCLLMKDSMGCFFEWFTGGRRRSQNFDSEAEALETFNEGGVEWV